jgi:FlaA1/EpsC-like NDP-sugar epimerase
MRKRILQTLTKGYLPRWVVLLFDLWVIGFSFVFSYVLRYNVRPLNINMTVITWDLLIVVFIYFIAAVIFHPYAGVIRNTTASDIVKIFETVGLGTMMLLGVTLAGRHYLPGSVFVIPISIIIIHTMVSGFLLTLSRLAIKYFFTLITSSPKGVKVMIYGAGELGHITLISIERTTDLSYRVAGFIDTNKKLQGMSKSGVIIYSPEQAMGHMLVEQDIKEVIIGVNPAKQVKKNMDEMYDFCLRHKITVKKVPPLNEWINGTFNARLIQPIDIEDLLGRDVITLDTKRIQTGLKDKTILITGAAGSIGSEMVRQLMIYDTGNLILLDQAESALYDLQMAIQAKYGETRHFEIVVADITNESRMRRVFEKYHPQIVFNAAAYKHVPLMEDNPCEAVRVNIGGTKILADLSVTFEVERFVMISTDKAVNPTNVMGASKRISEQYIQSLALKDHVKTEFVTTRFGNVLGSNGSVVPLFLKQIKNGGPVTVTHRDIRRYFMTIPEACQLVLEAGFMGIGGEIFVFDMGEPVRIWDLAEKMISLSGLIPGKDIDIVEVGLRPGEKLYEEVLAIKEKCKPTYNSRILIADVRKEDHKYIREKVMEMLDGMGTDGEVKIVARMLELVPEFKPQNERYKNASFVKN